MTYDETTSLNPISSLDVHGASVAGDGADGGRDRFAIADLAKSMRLRHTNLRLEDERGVLRSSQGHVLLVADGGSAGTGAAAARGLVEYFLDELPWYHLSGGEPDEVVIALEDAFRNAQAEIARRRGGVPGGAVPALTLAFVRWPDLYVAHVGDSRAFLARGGRAKRLTEDRTSAAIDRVFGGLVRREGRGRPRGARNVHPHVDHFVLEPGDTLVLLTDGVSADPRSPRFATALERGASAEELCGELLAGSSDRDRTTVVARFEPRAGERVPANPDDPRPTLQSRRRGPRGRSRRFRIYGTRG